MFLTTTSQAHLHIVASHHLYYSLFINCGGSKTTYGGNEYAADWTPLGPSYFATSEKWAYSTTGVFTDFYQTARLAPTSLRYYGLCLRKGSYKATLHFAEIMFSVDQTFSSLGRRYFDVSIQGNVVLKNFNIAKEAGGVGKPITKDFDTIVNDSTLAIHLYWSRKGTASLPRRAVYGPLLSAISVTPNFNPHSGGLPTGAIVGIIAATCVVVVLTVLLLRWKGYICAKDLEDKELRALNLQTGYFTLRQIKAATDNFDPAKKIGEGGFGPVYKGVLSDGSVIAVKQLSSKSKQGNREFVNEIGMISALQHPNLVRLYCCCIQGNQLLLIYEYMENNCLARALFGHEEQRLQLDWATRKKICLGVAKGLAYLHKESRLKIVHRDIKATNVLLDRDLNAKISDFGLAKLDEEENTHISTRIAGTFGYMAPEYAMHGYLTHKADVCSFGIVLLEIVSGRCNAGNRTKENSFYILDWALALKEKGNLMELVDPRLGSDFDREEVMVTINVALLCTDVSLAVRPAMSSVVSMLEGRMVLHELISEPTASSAGIKPESIQENRNDRQASSVSVDGQWTASSASAGDLYPVNLDSAYLTKRE
ncbi:Non-specific serine/threonine protein kinase [Bertholletia excelsa]